MGACHVCVLATYSKRRALLGTKECEYCMQRDEFSLCHWRAEQKRAVGRSHPLSSEWVPRQVPCDLRLPCTLLRTYGSRCHVPVRASEEMQPSQEQGNNLRTQSRVSSYIQGGYQHDGTRIV